MGIALQLFSFFFFFDAASNYKVLRRTINIIGLVVFQVGSIDHPVE